MNKKLHLLIVCLFFIGFQTTFSQTVKNEPQKPYYVGKPNKVEQVSSLKSRMSSLKRPDMSAKGDYQDGRSKSSKIDIVIGKGSKGDDALAKNPHAMKNSIPARAAEIVFETAASTGGGRPSDPAGAVGPNHYLAVTNSAIQIFDKNGTSLTGGLIQATSIFTFASGGCCDLTASYDNNADRWVMSYLSSAGEGTQVAVSDGPDPVNDGWTIYTFGSVSDYQKLSVWRDGYYMTENTSSVNKVHVFERDAMIDAASAGTTPQILSFSLPGFVTPTTSSPFHSPQVLNISNNNWPTTGGATIIYHQDDAWTGVTEDHIKVWTLDMDWATPGNSTVSAAQELMGADGVTSFVSVFDGGSFSNLAQPNGGGSLDALQATIMNQAQYRKFGTHNSAVFNFVVNVDGSGEQAGVRWYELRQTDDGQPWTVHQEGTYAAPDNKHAWNASLIMDVQGNIGMGYTAMSSANSTDTQVFAGSYYTGRFANDPLGTMTVAEEVITAGDSNFTGSTRYGDYSKIDVDPANDKKFWFVNELRSSGIKNIAGVFQIAPNFNNDIGVISVDAPVTGALSASESITVTIFNFGEQAASTFDVTYQVDGGTLVTEAYTGASIASNTSAQYTFTATADLSTEGQTYSIVASTDLTGDEDNGNDSFTQNVTHVFANDLGVTAITAPISDENLGNEAVTVTIENFGTASQSNFDVSYTINGGAAIVEQVAGPLAGGTTTSYTFTTLGDFSADGTYTVVAQTELGSDGVPSNNSTQVMVENSACNSYTNDTDMAVGPNANTVTTSVINVTDNVVITDVNVTINIDHTWDADLDVFLIAPDGTTRVELFTDVGGIAGLNFTNTVLDDDAATAITDGTPPFTGTFSPEGSLADFNGMSSLGDWTLEITDDANGDEGTLLDWTIQICSAPALSIDDVALEGDFKILNKGDDQFGIQLTSDTLIEDLDLNVYNMAGQNLLWKTLKKENGRYDYNLNMSYAASGVYLIRVGNNKAGVTKRIVVE